MCIFWFHRSTAIQSLGMEVSPSPRCPTGTLTTRRTTEPRWGQDGRGLWLRLNGQGQSGRWISATLTFSLCCGCRRGRNIFFWKKAIIGAPALPPADWFGSELLMERCGFSSFRLSSSAIETTSLPLLPVLTFVTPEKKPSPCFYVFWRSSSFISYRPWAATYCKHLLLSSLLPPCGTHCDCGQLLFPPRNHPVEDLLLKKK